MQKKKQPKVVPSVLQSVSYRVFWDVWDLLLVVENMCEYSCSGSLELSDLQPDIPPPEVSVMLLPFLKPAICQMLILFVENQPSFLFITQLVASYNGAVGRS